MFEILVSQLQPETKPVISIPIDSELENENLNQYT